jgi:hypothetical protein
LRRDLISVAPRTARHGRGHITLHLPETWHRQAEWMNHFEAACRSGLTSPGPVAAHPVAPLASPAQRQPRSPVKFPDTCTNGERQVNYARRHTQDQISRIREETRSPEFGRWIEA